MSTTESDPAGLDSLRSSRIFVAGHRGMVGQAIVKRLQAAGCEDLLIRDRKDLDLSHQTEVRRFLQQERPDCVFVAAARVGGINANNSYPAQFIYDNLMISANVIEAAWRAGVDRLLFLGSSCIYPRMAPQPISERTLLTGPLEPTNEPYAIAKIAGIKLCESFNRQYGTDYRSVMPTNLYGPHDNFDLETSHVLPALIRKFHEAKVEGADTVKVWGTGKPRREFLHVDDLADACVFVASLSVQTYSEATKPMLSHLNVGTGTDVSISELAALIRDVVDFEGQIVFNVDYPDGTPRKLLDVSMLESLGWRAKTPLKQGIEKTYAWYCDHSG